MLWGEVPLATCVLGSPGLCQVPLAVSRLGRWHLGAVVGDRSWVCALEGEDHSPWWFRGSSGWHFSMNPRIPSGLGAAVPVLSLPWPPRHPASSSESPPPGPGVAQEAELLQTFAFPSALPAGSAQSRKGGSVFGVLQCLEGTGSEGAPGDTRVPLNFSSPSGAVLPSLGQQLGLHLFVA